MSIYKLYIKYFDSDQDINSLRAEILSEQNKENYDWLFLSITSKLFKKYKEGTITNIELIRILRHEYYALNMIQYYGSFLSFWGPFILTILSNNDISLENKILQLQNFYEKNPLYYLNSSIYNYINDYFIKNNLFTDNIDLVNHHLKLIKEIGIQEENSIIIFLLNQFFKE